MVEDIQSLTFQALNLSRRPLRFFNTCLFGNLCFVLLLGLALFALLAEQICSTRLLGKIANAVPTREAVLVGADRRGGEEKHTVKAIPLILLTYFGWNRQVGGIWQRVDLNWGRLTVVGGRWPWRVCCWIGWHSWLVVL